MAFQDLSVLTKFDKFHERHDDYFLIVPKSSIPLVFTFPTFQEKGKQY